MANIVFIGYRGAGKSVVSRIIAEKLHLESIGMDARIEEKMGMTIPELVAKHGWNKFRDIESEVVKEIAGKDNRVIDTGGGVILREKNTENLKKNGIIFWLKATKDTIVKRIKDGSERPALSQDKTFLEEVEEILEERTPKYLAAADYIVDTENRGIEAVADEIIDIFSLRAT